jgi:hypothetical protein
MILSAVEEQQRRDVVIRQAKSRGDTFWWACGVPSPAHNAAQHSMLQGGCYDARFFSERVRKIETLAGL